MESSSAAAAAITRPLLLEKKADYYENCPGCKMDLAKQNQTVAPYKLLSYIWLVSLCTALPISSLFPFLYFMIRDFHIAKVEEDIGFYAGFMGSSFMVGRALTSVFWGLIADRYGRKPVILIGTFSVVIFNTIFGLSSTYWMGLSMRFLLGCFNGLLATIRAYASEVCSDEYQAIGLSVVSTSRGIGLIIGPAIGGFFAQPAESFPNIFSQSSLFGRFPYFLPCLIISVYAAGAFVLCLWLPETLHMHHERISNKGRSCDVEASEASPDVYEKESTTTIGKVETSSYYDIFKNWPLMSTIFVYCVFSLQEIAYTEIFSLWAVSDRKFGGLSFSSKDVGVVLAISGGGLLVFQLLLYPPVEKVLGPLTVTRLSALVSIPLLWSYPYIARLSGLTLNVVLNCASLIRNVLSVSLVTGLFILLNNAIPQHQRGAANGISLTAMSVTKAFGPAGAGALFSWAQKRQVAWFFPDYYRSFLTKGWISFMKRRHGVKLQYETKLFLLKEGGFLWCIFSFKDVGHQKDKGATLMENAFLYENSFLYIPLVSRREENVCKLKSVFNLIWIAQKNGMRHSGRKREVPQRGRTMVEQRKEKEARENDN